MKEIIEKIISDKIEGTQVFLVEMNILKNKVEIIIDGDAGSSLEDCALLNRHLHRRLEEMNIDAGEFMVEISSPGLERDIKGLRTYKKNVGRNLRVRNSQGKYLSGKLAMVDERGIMLAAVNQNKKLEFINYSEIQEAKAII